MKWLVLPLILRVVFSFDLRMYIFLCLYRYVSNGVINDSRGYDY